MKNEDITEAMNEALNDQYYDRFHHSAFISLVFRV